MAACDYYTGNADNCRLANCQHTAIREPAPLALARDDQALGIQQTTNESAASAFASPPLHVLLVLLRRLPNYSTSDRRCEIIRFGV